MNDDRVTYRVALFDPNGSRYQWCALKDITISGGFRAVQNHVSRYVDWTLYDPTDNVEEYLMRVAAPNCEKVYFRKKNGKVSFVGWEELAALGITLEVR